MTATWALLLPEGETGGTGGTGGSGGTGGAGSVWYDGHGVPDPGLGNVGDYYLDDDTGNIYKKTGEGW